MPNLAYCSVNDVCAAFPQFAPAAAGSVSDAQILIWIEDWTARIYSAFLTRGINLSSLTFTAIQTSFLQALSIDGAAAELGAALQGVISLQPGEYSLPAARRRSAERVLKEIREGIHDALFGVTPAGTSFGGIGGAETTPGETAEDLEENRSFSKGDVF